MATSIRSFAKVNLGLAIGPLRPDGFHSLSTLYQTIALHDVVTVRARKSNRTSILLTSNNPKVPLDARNTAWKMVEGALVRAEMNAEVEIHIEKRLPVQGGMGAGSANAAAALIALENELHETTPDRMELAAEVGSDVPLFLVGGSVLGEGRGELVSEYPDMPVTHCVVAIPEVGVSTPAAFQAWDEKLANQRLSELGEKTGLPSSRLAPTIEVLSRAYASCNVGPSGIFNQVEGLAENRLLALVRTGIENDFEEVVFPQYPPLRDIKRELANGAVYAALSGSGSAVFGLYETDAAAKAAQQRVQALGVEALVTQTLPREEYWRDMFAE